MITAFSAGVVLALLAVSYIGLKYHSAKAALAAVKTEVAKIESELGKGVSVEEAKVQQAVSSVVARLKKLL